MNDDYFEQFKDKLSERGIPGGLYLDEVVRILNKYLSTIEYDEQGPLAGYWSGVYFATHDCAKLLCGMDRDGPSPLKEFGRNKK